VGRCQVRSALVCYIHRPSQSYQPEIALPSLRLNPNPTNTQHQTSPPHTPTHTHTCQLTKKHQQVDADVSTVDPRISRLEASEAAAPKAPLRLVAALEERLEAAAAQQARYGRSVEGVVKALVDDTSTLARAQRGTEGLVAGQQAQLQDTKEALLRSAQVGG